MGPVSLLCAVAGVVLVALGGLGTYVAVGLGIFALGSGFLGYRHGRHARGRLSGAAGIAVGAFALALAGAQIGLTLVAIDRIERLLGS